MEKDYIEDMFVRGSKERFGVSYMNKKKIILALLSAVFVIAAGIVYLRVAPAQRTEDMLGFADAVTEPSVSDATTAETLAEVSDGTEETVSSNREPEWLYVHVCGAVQAPGVYLFPVGARVFDALTAAGGMLPEAAADILNQAECLWDGEQLYVYTQEEAAKRELVPGQQSMTQSAQTTEDGCIDLNTATLEQLMQLPGIGQAKAEAILAYRQEQGGFENIEELMQIPGIKENVFRKLNGRIMIRD